MDHKNHFLKKLLFGFNQLCTMMLYYILLSDIYAK